MNKTPVSVIILTLNEEIHIKRCLENIVHWADEIFIVDSYSTDKTLEIARRYGVKIIQHEFKNQAQQFNWALDNLEISAQGGSASGGKNEWILRLDADEYLTEELKKEITQTLTNTDYKMTNTDSPHQSASSPHKSAIINGFYIKRRVYFMGRWIKHGGYYPTWFLRLFRKNKAEYEEREVDEHMILLQGKTLKLRSDFIDDNRNKLEWWLNKQNWHSSREILAIMNENKNLLVKPNILSGQVSRKRWFKEKIYLKLPMFCRTFLYFFYRYFLRLGFLDGKEGLIFHFLSAMSYRFIVDAKLYEYRKNLNREL